MLARLLLDVFFVVVIHVAFTHFDVDKDIIQTLWWALGGNGCEVAGMGAQRLESQPWRLHYGAC